MPETEDEKELRRLMASYQAGDASAFDRLYARLAPPLHGYLARWCRDRARAEDLLQETFLHLHEARHSYDPARPLAPWAFAIARHVGLMHARRQSRAREVALAAGDERVSSDASTAQADVDGLLARIERERRDAVVLHHVWGFSFEQIAARFGITAGAARVRAHRALQALRRLVGRRRP